MKRSIQAVLALLVVAAGFGLAAAPSGAAPPPAAKVFTISAAPASSVWSQSVKLTVTLTPKGGGQPKGGTVTFLAERRPARHRHRHDPQHHPDHAGDPAR